MPLTRKAHGDHFVPKPLARSTARFPVSRRSSRRQPRPIGGQPVLLAMVWCSGGIRTLCPRSKSNRPSFENCAGQFESPRIRTKTRSVGVPVFQQLGRAFRADSLVNRRCASESRPLFHRRERRLAGPHENTLPTGRPTEARLRRLSLSRSATAGWASYSSSVARRGRFLHPRASEAPQTNLWICS